MSVGGIIVGLVIFAVLMAALLQPLLRRGSGTEAAFLNKQRERALAYYERVLTNIHDLDEDHATGKMDADAYAIEREVWVERGVRLLKMLDELDSDHQFVDNRAADDAEIDAAIEEAIASVKRKPSAEMG